ncbi:MAG: 16S rRNA (uracil(1498)-N(3))-methyltransferase [Syntrophomonadaceae bacterium]|nr:16S rRNA (uracil(1498)-N(3))-methyltransferase [Syntrophomonadaceae bacterium]MDD3890457.1 16S rRNA (uracil(1498)-N(3))-methyltransferase [Syntrophomonadaceae bacterium]MDD4549480.1 16S rRNA (uracil(1498)-N(3))-methyltransferase [Syntrophomonadaceae bacterium]
MHRFFVSADNITATIVRIDSEQSRHIEKVLRLKPGDTIILFDGSGAEYQARILGKDESNLLLAEIASTAQKDNEPGVKLSLVQGIARGEKMDTIIQKAVEVGVSTIYPLQCERAVVQLKGEKAQKKVNRWQVIAREACKQCRRNIIPEVKPVISFYDLLRVINTTPAIMLYENEQKLRLKKVLDTNRDNIISQGLYLIVGPEGGFSPREVETAQESGCLTAGLGPRILRTETAGIVASSLVLYEFNDLG